MNSAVTVAVINPDLVLSGSADIEHGGYVHLRPRASASERSFDAVGDFLEDGEPEHVRDFS